ncbi:MAG: hypothetical protein DMF61_08435 [Blastocatellia bacterium AA13]|nr:MAG: hypothetical protein DMF61_08435 [Blastocatellia bacterium AA13]
MLVPPGKPVYENLATSYVLLDALISDLCEGGFSGIVEVVLRGADGHVIINQGKVAGSFDGSGSKQEATTVSDLAARARAERGRISVYGCSIETAEALSGCANAEPLYTRLSTEFADIERMISKLGRERDREWFIEIYAEGAQTGLVHIKDGSLWAFSSRAEGDSQAIVKDLIAECNSAGGIFDVYFRRPLIDASQNSAEEAGITTGEQTLDFAPAEPSTADLHDEADFTKEPAHSQPQNGDESHRNVPISSVSESTSLPETPIELPDLVSLAIKAESIAISPDNGARADRKRDTGDALSMATIKQLLGEIAGAIEKSVRAVEPRDTFAMYLRAGQLKIADRYPFLDPFGAEFEYMTGEIAFVGRATPTEFIDGMTEALRLAMNSITDTSSQPSRLRARVSDDLHNLLESRKDEFEPFGLDHAIEWILR